MPSLLFIPLGFAVWVLCYGPVTPGRSVRGGEGWQRTTETSSVQDEDLALLLPVAEPEDTERDGAAGARKQRRTS